MGKINFVEVMNNSLTTDYFTFLHLKKECVFPKEEKKEIFKLREL